MTIRERIDDFLSHKRLAVIGVSRNPRDFSRVLYRELMRRGYDLVPVNPNMTDLGSKQCFANVAAITPPVEWALLMTPASQSEAVVEECARAGIRRVWLHRGAGGAGAWSEATVRKCEQLGIDVVPGYCPFMFLSPTGMVHRVHAFFKRLNHTYPRAA